MATSGSTNFVVTRDDIITRALRIVGGVGQNETPDPSAITEAALALNMIVKERQADGMQLWKMATSTPQPLTASVNSYIIGIGGAIPQTAPLKILQAWMRTTATNADSPMNLLTKADYDRYGVKTSTGTPSEVYYKPPGPNVPEIQGTLTFYPTPDANCIATQTFVFTGIYPIQDFDASTDNPDFPGYYFNALTWLLAAELAYEYGVPLQERGMISKMAQDHLMKALSFDIEEGSFYIQPEPDYD
jgi:hypothetical protein